MSAKKIKIAFSFAIVAALLIWIVVSGFNENMQYYVSIEQVKTMGQEAYTKGMRVKGRLVPGSVVKSNNSLDVDFRLEENGHEMKVHYAKELPDTFVDGAEVLVEGKLTPQGYFDATMLMAKCPSKYETNTDEYNADVTQERRGTY